MSSDTEKIWPLRDALNTARAVLDHELGMIEGCIALARYAHEVVPNWAIDHDFVVFGAVASSADHLPFGQVRAHWSATPLDKADAEITAINQKHGEAVRKACRSVIERFSAGKRSVTLYRPVGPKELDLIVKSGWREFPPRLPDQPIFYPVTNEAYATQIARDWNVKASGAGFVTRFNVNGYYLSRYRVEKVGGAKHTEYWIPAEDLAEFNRNIHGIIEVIAEFK